MFTFQMGSESDLAPLISTPPPAYESVDQSFEVTFQNALSSMPHGVHGSLSTRRDHALPVMRREDLNL